MTSSMTILLVDEEPLLRRATALMLTDRGGEVSAVATLGEAIALTERRIFDVAVIDVPAKGPSPDEILAQLRAHGLLPRRVVVCACAPPARSFAEPAAAVIAKPYMFEHLLTAVFGPRSRRRQASRSGTTGVFSAARGGEASPLASELKIGGRASRLRGRRRKAGAVRALPGEHRTGLSATFRGPRRAARARRGHG